MPWVLSSLRTCGVGWAPLLSHSRIRSSFRRIVDGSVCGLYWPIVSMKRPSRGERWSATTTRQIGFFLLPTRVSLTRTLISRARLATAGQFLQVGHLPPRELAHQLLHLAELLDQLADRLNGGARAPGDAPAARAVDDLRIGALLRRHRLDDRLEAVQLALVEVHVAELGAHPRHH